MNKKEFFLISVTIFLTVVIWLIADIYYVTQKQRIKTPNLPNVKNYNLDNEIFNQLNKKEN